MDLSEVVPKHKFHKILKWTECKNYDFYKIIVAIEKINSTAEPQKKIIRKLYFECDRTARTNV